jgi:hypothetical protein
LRLRSLVLTNKIGARADQSDQQTAATVSAGLLLWRGKIFSPYRIQLASRSDGPDKNQILQFSAHEN